MPGNAQDGPSLNFTPYLITNPGTGLVIMSIDENGALTFFNQATGNPALTIDAGGVFTVYAVSGSPNPIFFSDGQNNGLMLETGAALYADGVRVVSGQQPAIADSTTTVGSVSAQLNALLGALRAHGLIAA